MNDLQAALTRLVESAIEWRDNWLQRPSILIHGDKDINLYEDVDNYRLLDPDGTAMADLARKAEAWNAVERLPDGCGVVLTRHPNGRWDVLVGTAKMQNGVGDTLPAAIAAALAAELPEDECDHKGIGKPGCWTCDPVRIQQRREAAARDDREARLADLRMEYRLRDLAARIAADFAAASPKDARCANCGGLLSRPGLHDCKSNRHAVTDIGTVNEPWYR